MSSRERMKGRRREIEQLFLGVLIWLGLTLMLAVFLAFAALALWGAL